VKSDHWGVPISLDYTPDGRFLATIGRHTDSEIYLVDPETGNSERHLLRHQLCGAAVRISPNGKFLASASDDASIRLYDLAAPYRPVD
jgi:WD40 repeat protein